MKYLYTLVGDFRQPHKDSCGEVLTNLSYKEVMKIVEDWRKEKKYKKIFWFRQID